MTAVPLRPRRRGAAGASRLRPRRALAGRRARLAQQGAREHHRRAGRRPRPWRSRGDPPARSASRRPIRTSPRCTATWPSSAWRPRCTSPGHASDAAVASAYASADVLVVTSEHEGFCVPVVEAMAAGVPVVAFDQGAVPEVLGGAGVLVSDKDPYALASAIAGAPARRTPPRRPRRGGATAAGRARPRFGRRPVRRPARPAGRAGRRARRERHPPVRPDAAPRRRGRTAHAAPARCPGGARHPLAHLRGGGRPGDGARDPPVRALRRRGRGRGRARLPIRHRLGHRPVARRPHRDAGRELPQRDAARVLRPLGQRHGAAPAPGRRHSYGSWLLAPRSAWPCPRSTRRSCARPASAAPRWCRPPPWCRPAPLAGRPGGRRHPRGTAGARWVSVGRLAPNKAIELAVMAFLVARAHARSGGDARRWWAGRSSLPTRRRCIASSTSWACTHAVTFARRAERRRAGGRTWPSPTCWW